MSFTSIFFLVFLAAFLLLWPLVRRTESLRLVFLVGASLLFYGWWDWRYVFLLLSVAVISYLSSVVITRNRSLARAALIGCIVAEIAILAFFKYSGFLASELGLGAIRPDLTDFFQSVVLPVGLSFYVFSALSYTIDIYRGDTAPARGIIHYLGFLAFFPHLVAGPIIRARQLLPQLEGPGDYTARNRWSGLKLMVRGFFKKLVIADSVAPVVNLAFMANPETGLVYWWAVALLFGIQIYCDFSGYSDIARGISRWIGYELPVNFRYPYSAVGFRNFWTRWHITLSAWMRDYIYVPLGGSRTTPALTFRNIWITMLVCGLWHGANWTFIAWGAFHAALLTIERLLGAWTIPNSWITRNVAAIATFIAVTVGWVLFRAPTLAIAWQIMAVMFGGPYEGISELLVVMSPNAWLAVGLFIMGGVLRRIPRRLWCVGLSQWQPVEMFVLVAAVWACIFLRGVGDEFIYFQF